MTAGVRVERGAAVGHEGTPGGPRPARVQGPPKGPFVAQGDRATYASGEASSAPQTVKAQLALRELILGGELKTGARIAELWLVERLGVSRTPVRLALVRLAEEGLLDALPSGGYAVKEFSESDIQDAIEVRGTLEGLAARLAAERGVSPVLITEARECLERIDTALAQPALTDATFSVYVEENARFHALLSEMAGSALVARQLDKAKALPFASPNGFVMAHSVGPRARDVLVVAQEQHRMVIEAIVQREGARAEALMREHARIARRNLQQALRSHQSLLLVPGGRLIRRRSER
ncbi:MAG: GntR family transcriptional regulator [Rhizobacter sp.]|nr:GntR family transcriptional regulator [Rhizobacter sp.]